MTVDERSRTPARASAPAEQSFADPFQVRPAQPPLRPRRRPKLIAAGVLAVCLGGLAGAAIHLQSIDQTPVIMVTRAVARGEVIEAADLGTVGIGAAPGLATVPAAELESLIGQTARIDLAAGSVLPAGAVGADPLPEGFSRVGLRLPAGRLPTSPLPPGEPVSLVPVQPTSGENDDKLAGIGPVAATIAASPELAPDQSAWLVDVSVPTGDARLVTELAATDRIALVHEAG
ncbi:SAF domain-containing protein [Naumannella huperziae]